MDYHSRGSNHQTSLQVSCKVRQTNDPLYIREGLNTHIMAQYITYYRVSTKDQNLGLIAQQSMVEHFIKDQDEVLASFTEKETGTNKKERPILSQALEMCQQTGSVLLIAKLDRLARNVAFISTLMDSGIEFKALDMPTANKLTIHIFAAIAEHEAEIISQRTKAALDELRKQGVKLGKPENLTAAGRAKGVKAIKQKARDNSRNKQASAFICSLVKEGLNLSEIARKLNEHGFTTSRGKQFHAKQVSRLMDKYPC